MEDKKVIEGIQEYWNVRSDSYSRQNLEEMNNWKREAWRKKILSMAPEKETLDILDIGTGPGFFAINLALAGHRVTAVDVTEGMLNHARENASAYGAQVNFQQQNGDTLSFPDQSFDLIINRNVIWNLERPERAMEEWKRVLRPGGRMVYFDANWYLYLFDEKVASYKEEVWKKYHHDYDERGKFGDKVPREKVQMLEDIARKLPLSRKHRPAWDRQIMEQLNMKVICVQEDISADVLNEHETIDYMANPMFMMCAEKQAETVHCVAQ